MPNLDYSSRVADILKRKEKIATPNSLVSLWEKWYKGKVPSFHNYVVYNGDSKQRCQRLSMHMAKQVPEDWASLLMNEKVEIVVTTKDKMEELLMNLDFYNKANESVEKGFALSMSALVNELDDMKFIIDEETGEGVYDYENSNPIMKLALYSVKKIVPISFMNGECTECAFVQENTNEKIITIHQLDENKNYDIVVINLDEKDVIKSSFTIKTNAKYRWFSLIYPRITNFLDVDSPYPISIFAGAIDTLKAIDCAYDSYNNEFLLGRKRTYVSSEMFVTDKETGEEKKVFDPNDTIIYRIPNNTSINGEKPLIVTDSTELRAEPHSRAIQDHLNFLSKQCGLGVDYYRFEKGRVMTATQVISEKSDTFRNLKKHEGVLEKSIISLIKSMMFIYNTFVAKEEVFKNIDNVNIKFDDSIIEDKNTEKTNDQKDVELGVLSKNEYRAKWYGEDIDSATEKVKAISGDVDLQSRLTHFAPFYVQGAMTSIDFVKNVYIGLDEAKQQELALQLEEARNKSENLFEVPNIYNPSGNEE